MVEQPTKFFCGKSGSLDYFIFTRLPKNACIYNEDIHSQKMSIIDQDKLRFEQDYLRFEQEEEEEEAQ